MKRKTTEKSEPNKKKFVVFKYTVVQFDGEDHGKMFECIPDLWFVNALRESCYFPPKTGKSYVQRAVNCEKPDDNWGIYECTIVKGGFLTYNAGFKLVQEKCSQRYNTSSAEEERQAADFRRQHPGLLLGGNIEHVFSKPQTTVHESVTHNHDKTEKSVRNVNEMPTSNNDVMISVGNNEITEESAKTHKRNKQSSCIKPTAIINIEKTTSTTSENAQANLQSSSSICSKGPSRCGSSTQSLHSRFDSSRSRSRSQQSTARPRSAITRPSISPKLNRLNGKSSHASRIRASRSHSSARSSRSRSSRRSETSRQSTRSKANHSRSNGRLSHKNGIRDSLSHSSVRSSRSRSSPRSETSRQSTLSKANHSRSNANSSHTNRIRDSWSHSSVRLSRSHSTRQRSSPCLEISRQSTSPRPNHSRSNANSSHTNRIRDSRSHLSARSSRSRSNPRSEISRQSTTSKPNHSRSKGKPSHTNRIRDSRSHSSVRLSRSHSTRQRSSPCLEISRQSTSPRPNHSRSNANSSHTNRIRDSWSHLSVRLSSPGSTEISRQPTSPKPNRSRSKGKPSHTNGIRCHQSNSSVQLRKNHSLTTHRRSRRSSFRSSSDHSSILSCHSRSKRKRTVDSRSHPSSSKASKIIRTANVTSTQERSNKPVQNCKQSSSRKHSSSTDSRNHPLHEDPSRQKTMDHLISSINEMTEAVKKSNDRMTQNDRRLNRLEVTVNKILITLGDMNGHNLTHDDNDLDADFEGPELPIVSKTELYMVNRKLKDKEFQRLWINKERHFCCPTKTSTDTRTITKYLKRFIALRVRSQLTLKEQGGESEYTLYRDYRRVYEFLINVMKDGYKICRKKISRDEAHTALRVVWGRSKQLYSAEKKKNSRL